MVEMLVSGGLQLGLGGLVGVAWSVFLAIIFDINMPHSLEMRHRIKLGIESMFAYDIETDFQGDRTVDSFLPKPRHEMNQREARWFQKFYEKAQREAHTLQQRKDYAEQRIAQLDKQRATFRSQQKPITMLEEG